MIWRTIDYDFPFAFLLLLLVVPIGACLFFLYRDRKNKLEAFASPPILERILEKRELFWVKTFLFCLAWLCGVIALMQPKGNERYAASAQVAPSNLPSPADRPLRKKAHEVILLVDASSSMNIADVSGRTRLDAAKAIADDLISRLRGENISLFAFTGSTMQIVPSTLDYLFTRLMLRQIQINEGETDGTNIQFALDFIKKLYFEKPSSTTKTVILFSDGGDTRLTGLDPEQTKQTIQEIVSPIANAEENNLRLFTVGLGSSEGANVPGVSFQGHPVVSALEEPLLRKLAVAGRGELFVLGDMTSLQIAQKLAQNIAREESFVETNQAGTPSQQDNSRLYDLYFQIPLGIAILALAGCLFLPDTRKKGVRILSIFLTLSTAASLDAQDPTQLARAYFEAGDYAQAKREYEWLLDESMPKWQQETLQYNMGTALLSEGSWEEAIPYFQNALSTSSPILKQRAAANLAAARLMQLQSQLSSLPKDSPISIQLFLLFRQALSDLEKAHTAWCELEKIEGATFDKCPLPSSDYQKAQKYLESVLHRLTEARPLKARLQDAVDYLYHREESLKADSLSIQQIANILENLIAQEEFLLLLYQLDDSKSPDSPDATQESGDISFSNLQKSTIAKAQTFPPNVLEYQRQSFSRTNSINSCQCQPWDEVIPLFYTGYHHAIQASEVIKEENQGAQVKESIKKAKIAWKEALTKMRTPPSPAKQREPKPASESESQPGSQSQNEPQNTKLYDLLRTLQDMEQDDKSKPVFKTATSADEERPW